MLRITRGGSRKPAAFSCTSHASARGGASVNVSILTAAVDVPSAVSYVMKKIEMSMAMSHMIDLISEIALVAISPRLRTPPPPPFEGRTSGVDVRTFNYSRKIENSDLTPQCVSVGLNVCEHIWWHSLLNVP